MSAARRRLRMATALAVACIPAWPVASAEAPWKHSMMTYSAKGTPVRQVLTDIAATQPFSITVEGGVRGEVKGEFHDPAKQVFGSIVDAYDLTWFYDGFVIYVSPASESRSEVVQTAPLTPAQAMAALRRLGLVESRFPLRASRGALLVTGPGRYIELVAKAVAAEREYATAAEASEQRRDEVVGARGPGKQGSEGQRRIMVFPLSHAQAADTDISGGGESREVPGVASILRSLLDGDSPSWHVAAGGETFPGSNASYRERVPGLLSEGIRDESARRPVAAREAGTRVEADVRTNAVLVYDFPSTRPYYQEVIAALDRRGRLVRLDVAIVDIDSSALRDIGVDLGIRGTNVDGQTLPSLDGGGAHFQGVIGSGATKLTARLAALEQVGKARVMYRPSLHTLDNVPAIIGNKSTAYARVAGNQATDLFPISAGLQVNIRPQIVPGDSGVQKVRLAITVQNGRLDGAGTVDGLPVATDNFVSTEARVPDGATLMFGGYRYDRGTHEQSGVPGLRSVPIVGGAFRRTSKREDHFERMFLITPRIVDEDDATDKGIDVDAIHASDPLLELPAPPLRKKGPK